MSKKDLLKNVIELEEYFLTGLKKATQLRSELEGSNRPSSRKGGLSVFEKDRLRDKRMKTFRKPSAHA